MFSRKKRREGSEEECARIIGQALEAFGRSLEAAAKLKSQDGLLSFRMLAYFDQWVASNRNLRTRLTDIRYEKDIFEVFRHLLRSHEDLMFELEQEKLHKKAPSE